MDQSAPLVSQNYTEPENIGKEFKNYQNKWQLILLGLLILTILLILGIIAYVIIDNNGKVKDSKISTFDECVAAGFPVMESYPRQCRASSGEVFVEEVDGVGIVSTPKDLVENKQIKIFFGKNPVSFDSSNIVCSVIRETNSTDLISFALDELIKGPTSEEASEGLYSEINLVGESNCEGKDYKYTIDNGNLTVQFCKRLDLADEMQGDCVVKTVTQSIMAIDKVDRLTILDFEGNEIY